MLKSWKEMYEIDVLPVCEKREAKDDKGKKIQVPYLNWAMCMKLLHDNGAENVYFEPCVNEKGSSLFMSDQVFIDKNEVTNRCYEVRVKIVIDDLEFEAQYPLMNGSNPVRDNSMTQQRVWNAQTRAFVKGVAMRTGLGFSLWVKNDEAGDASPMEDLSSHSIFAIRERMQQKFTELIKKGMSTVEVGNALKIQSQTGHPEEDLQKWWLGGVFDYLYWLETEMAKL